MASFHYRFAILEPVVRNCGLGVARGPRMTYIVLTPDQKTLTPTTTPAIYPPDKLTDVPTNYDSGEIPDPIPESKDRNAGFPIWVQFPYGKKVTEVSATLSANGKDVPFWISTPEKPVEEGFQRNTVCMIAKQALKPETTYNVSLKSEVEWDCVG